MALDAEAVRVAIVCLYGVYWADEGIRSRREIAGYEQYLSALINYVKREGIIDIILCGGTTNPNVPVSEARSVKEYLSDKLPAKYHLYLEESSRNSPQNVYFGRRLVEQFAGSDAEIVVVCDRIRILKIWVLTWKMCRPYRFKVVGFDRDDEHPSSTRLRQLVQAVKYLLLPVRWLVK